MSKPYSGCAPTDAIKVSCLLFYMCLNAQTVQANTFQACLLREIQTADEHLPVGDIRSKCEQETQYTASSHNVAQKQEPTDKKIKNKLFTLSSYKANYVLPITYSWEPEANSTDVRDDELDNEEVKFQLSFKVPIYNDLPILGADLYFGYTQLSFWQAYNRDVSSPFRETNYEPEIFLARENDRKLFGFTNTRNSLGLVHQSNGQGGELSRSWNRIYLQMLFERGNFQWAIKPWWRIPEADKNNPFDANGDDNPDIERYVGNFEWTGLYHWRNHNFSFMVRNNLRSENRGAIELGWSVPVSDYIRLYLQYFNGYGESLINYDNNTNRFGIGFELTNGF